MSVDENTRLVKSIASDLGFSFCGISKAEFLEEEAPRLEAWLTRGYAGKMSYLERNLDKRLDPRLLVPGAQSVVSLLYNYAPREKGPSGELKLSKYAYGEDYHHVIKERLAEFLHRLRDKVGGINGRVFVDSAPVHERAWAARSGLDWKKQPATQPAAGQLFLPGGTDHRSPPVG
jgi:epoxyqueuosine reductase